MRQTCTSALLSLALLFGCSGGGGSTAPVPAGDTLVQNFSIGLVRSDAPTTLSLEVRKPFYPAAQVVLAAPPVAGGEPADGVVWGRLVLEEESPDGAWTPMPGAEVQLYPASPALLAELERIRHGARDSLRSHDTAADRLQAALRSHQTPGDPAKRDGSSGPALRGVTDPAGVFVIEAVPA